LVCLVRRINKSPVKFRASSAYPRKLGLIIWNVADPKMRLTDQLGIETESLKGANVLNINLEKDNRYYVDFRLLRECKEPEFENGYEAILAHFGNAMAIAPHAKGKNKVAKSILAKLLTFPEAAEVRLGFGKETFHGAGIGAGGQSSLGERIHDILDLGVTDPELLSMMFIFEVGVGADKLTDMACQILKTNIEQFTERVNRNLELSLEDRNPRAKNILIYDGVEVFYLPKQILRKLPNHQSWADVLDDVSKVNVELRKFLNSGLFEGRAPTKHALQAALSGSNNLRAEFFEAFKTSSPDSVEKSGVLAEDEYADSVRKFASPAQAPKINLPTTSVGWANWFIDYLNDRCKANHIPRSIALGILASKGETAAQRFITELATAIRFSLQAVGVTAFTVHSEINDGLGPCDFFIGYDNVETAIELKLSTNSWQHGVAEQLPAYMDIGGFSSGILLVLLVKEHSGPTEAEIDAHWLAARGQRVHKIHGRVVDGRIKASASKK
jgi:hypothetical protein